jgi:putative lipoprotein
MRRRSLLVLAAGLAAGARAATPDASLHNTYWKLTELDGEPVAPLPGQPREARITLASPGGRLFGFGGCQRLEGQYTLQDGPLRLLPGRPPEDDAGCSAELRERQQRLLDALAATHGHRIEGDRLALLDRGGQVLARFEAVYLR